MMDRIMKVQRQRVANMNPIFHYTVENTDNSSASKFPVFYREREKITNGQAHHFIVTEKPEMNIQEQILKYLNDAGKADINESPTFRPYFSQELVSRIRHAGASWPSAEMRWSALVVQIIIASSLDHGRATVQLRIAGTSVRHFLRDVFH
jgi:hypothetical protein